MTFAEFVAAARAAVVRDFRDAPDAQPAAEGAEQDGNLPGFRV